MKWNVKMRDHGGNMVTRIIDAVDPYEAEEKAMELVPDVARELNAQPEEIYVEAMEREEDKQMICDALLETLQLTRALYSLEDLRYLPEKELVEATFSNGYRKYANVAADSGIAMIMDVIKQIV